MTQDDPNDPVDSGADLGETSEDASAVPMDQYAHIREFVDSLSPEEFDFLQTECERRNAAAQSTPEEDKEFDISSMEDSPEKTTNAGAPTY